MSRSKLVLIAFTLETIFAGANGVAIRYSNRELAPLWGAGLRFALAAILINFLMISLKLPVPRGKNLFGAILFGLFQFAGAFGFAYIALVQIHAGLGQTLLALVPLATLLLSIPQRQGKLTGPAVLGTLLGVIGIGIITFDPSRETIPLTAILAAMASVVCFSQALIIVRQFPSLHPVSLNAVGMSVGALVLFGASRLFDEPLVLPQLPETWIALLYVVVIGSVVVFLFHVYIAQVWNASRAAYIMVTTPLITIIFSAWLDQEQITGGLLAGAILVIIGVYIGALIETR